MSEPEPVRGVVVAHGLLADGLVDAVRRICGADTDALHAVSNLGLAPDGLAEAVRSAAGLGPVVVFTDLVGGSCGFVATRLSRDLPEVAVIGGVNLPLLLEFVNNRELSLTELLPRLLDRGRAAICCASKLR